MATTGELWQKVRAGLGEFIVNHEMISWIDPLKAEKIQNGELVLWAPNKLVLRWVNEHFLVLLNDTVKSKSNGEVEKVIVILNPDPPKVQLPLEGIVPDQRMTLGNCEKTNGFGLNPRLTFNSFIAGPHNAYALDTCKKVAEGNGEFVSWSPLFVSGQPGVGKTHLVVAMANAIAKAGTNGRGDVRFVTAEGFMNQFTQAIRNNGMEAFRKRFRNLGVLIVDDVQFLAGKERTQEELRFVIDELANKNSLVVFVADSGPRKLKGFETALQSRMGQGLSATLYPPTSAAAAEFVSARAARECPGEQLSAEALGLIVDNCSWNFRELEGAVISVIARASFDGLRLDELDAEYVEQILQLSGRKREPLTKEAIVKAVCEAFNIQERTVRGRGRVAAIVETRNLIGFLCFQLVNASYSEIGRLVNREHSSVMHGVKGFTARFREGEVQATELVKKVMVHLPGHQIRVEDLVQ